MTPIEQKIFDIQCESTKQLLLAQRKRSPAEDIEYITKIRMTPIALEAQCLKEDGSVDLNVRPLTQEQADEYNAFRRKRGSIIERLRNEKAVPTLTDEKRERATHAFMAKFTVEAIKQRFKDIMQHMFKPSYAEIVAKAMKEIK